MPQPYNLVPVYMTLVDWWELLPGIDVAIKHLREVGSEDANEKANNLAVIKDNIERQSCNH